MTELEQKADEYTKNVESERGLYINYDDIKQAYKDGYEYCQKDLFSWTDREQLLQEIAELKAENARLNEYVDTLTEQDKDTCGGLEAYRNENFTLKAEVEKLKEQMKTVQKICFDSCLQK